MNFNIKSFLNNWDAFSYSLDDGILPDITISTETEFDFNRENGWKTYQAIRKSRMSGGVPIEVKNNVWNKTYIT